MDITNLILKLDSIITSSPLDQQMISKAIQLLQAGAVEYGASYSELPTHVGNEGRLYYIAFDGLYFASSYGWVPIYKTNATSLWSWGSNCTSALGCGQLGDGTIINKSSPGSTVARAANWCQVATGVNFTLALAANCTLWSWGLNTGGLLGDGTTTTCRSSPVSVVGGFNDWCKIGAGHYTSFGIRTNGTLWAWGSNTSGRLGDGTFTARSVPAPVVGGFTDWCQVSAGRLHAAAVRSNGTAWTWGANTLGQLGDNTATNRSSPVSVVGGFTDWCQVAAGKYFSVGLRTNCTLWAWGDGTGGQLGDNTAVSKSSPVSVVGGFTDWCQVSTSHCHSLALRTNGTAWAWGNGTWGALGDNTTANKSSPVSVVGGFTDWCQVSAGNALSVGLRTNGTAWAWGCNGAGQLGDGTTVAKSSPASVVGGFTDWCRVSAGCDHIVGFRNTLL